MCRWVPNKFMKFESCMFQPHCNFLIQQYGDVLYFAFLLFFFFGTNFVHGFDKNEYDSINCYIKSLSLKNNFMVISLFQEKCNISCLRVPCQESVYCFCYLFLVGMWKCALDLSSIQWLILRHKEKVHQNIRALFKWILP